MTKCSTETQVGCTSVHSIQNNHQYIYSSDYWLHKRHFKSWTGLLHKRIRYTDLSWTRENQNYVIISLLLWIAFIWLN